MSNIKVKLTLSPVIVTLNKEDYKDAWQEYQEENGEVEEDEDAGEPSDEFVLDQYQEEVEEGVHDVATIFEDAAIDATIVDE